MLKISKSGLPLDLYWHIITTRAPDGANKFILGILAPPEAWEGVSDKRTPGLKEKIEKWKKSVENLSRCCQAYICEKIEKSKNAENLSRCWLA